MIDDDKLSYEKIISENEWYHQNHPDIVIDERKIDKDQLFSLGWKLHISVEYHQIVQAFNLAAPILSKYFKFKVVSTAYFDAPFREYDRGKNNMQFTICLYEKSPTQSEFSAEKLLEIMQTIAKIFKKAEIKPSKIPESDQLTQVTYFSLRCAGAEEGDNYLPAESIGSNFNALNLPGANYRKLLLEEHKFSAKTHFECLPAKNQSVGMTLIAMLNEYLDLSGNLILVHPDSKPIRYYVTTDSFFYIYRNLTQQIIKHGLVEGATIRIKPQYQHVTNIYRLIRDICVAVHFLCSFRSNNEKACYFTSKVHPVLQATLRVFDDKLTIRTEKILEEKQILSFDEKYNIIIKDTLLAVESPASEPSELSPKINSLATLYARKNNLNDDKDFKKIQNMHSKATENLGGYGHDIPAHSSTYSGRRYSVDQSPYRHRFLPQQAPLKKSSSMNNLIFPIIDHAIESFVDK